MLEKSFRQIRPHILFKIELSLLPELHDAHPDEGLGDASPLENGIGTDLYVIFPVGTAEIACVQHFIALENSHSPRRNIFAGIGVTDGVIAAHSVFHSGFKLPDGLA